MRKPIKMTANQLTKIRELTIEGLNPYQIAKRLSIPHAVARYHAKRVNIPHAEKLAPKSNSFLEAYNEYKRYTENLKKKKEYLLELFTQQLSHE
jgi:hypothetical protein